LPAPPPPSPLPPLLSLLPPSLFAPPIPRPCSLQNATGGGNEPPPQCALVIAGSAAGQAAWLSNVVAAATAAEVQLVSLAQARDILVGEVVSSCPCAAPLALSFYCDYVNLLRQTCYSFGLPSFACEAQAKVTGTTGVRDLDNDVKEPVYSTLQAARAAGAGSAGSGGELGRALLRLRGEAVEAAAGAAARAAA
jgi:hypothetical protein